MALIKVNNFNKSNLTQMQTPVAARSKAKVCGLSISEIVGSNPRGGRNVCLFWALCVVRWGIFGGMIPRQEES